MGIFDDTVNLFATYEATIKFRDKIMGGTPMDPKIIEGWIRTKAGVTDQEELQRMVYRTAVEMGLDVKPTMTYEELVKATETVAAIKQTCGFKRDEGGPYIEGRIIKSAIKENVNIWFAAERWGETGKGPKGFTAEHVYVNPDKIHFGVPDISGAELFIGHVSGPQGPQNTLTYYQYITQATISFEVIVAGDAIEAKHWPIIWRLAQENGLGSLRSQGHGRFDILKWQRKPGEVVAKPKRLTKEEREAQKAAKKLLAVV